MIAVPAEFWEILQAYRRGENGNAIGEKRQLSKNGGPDVNEVGTIHIQFSSSP
jgi:hypothetical protein